MIKKIDQQLVTVIPYDSHWPEQFTQDAQRIKAVLGTNCLEIHHIGSTAVPGLAAKPVIDMIPVVAEIEQVDGVNDLLLNLGYEAKGELGMPFRRFFTKGGTLRTHNIHVFEQNNSEIERHVLFRDWMRTHAADRAAYAQLKQHLAQMYPQDITAYCFGKEEFVTRIDKQTGFSGLRMVKALTNREWNAVRHLRQFYFFNQAGLIEPYEWTFAHEAHVHFTLYQGTEIIGYTHLQLWPKQRAAMRMLVIDEVKRNHRYGQQLLHWCERWLKSQGYQTLHLEASPQALGFYRNNGYIAMPFNDPDGYTGGALDTALGKIL